MTAVVFFKHRLDAIFRNESVLWFRNITREEWLLSSAEQDAQVKYSRSVIFYVSLVTTCVGFFGSSLSVIVLSRTDCSHQRNFQIYMVVISCCDMFYCATNLLPVIEAKYSFNFSKTSPTIIYFAIVASGVANYFSLCSDLCNLALTFERFLTLWKPLFWHNASANFKLRMLFILIVTALALGAIRFHYPMQFSVVTLVKNDSTTYIRRLSYFSETRSFHCWELVSLLVLPATVLVLMVVFSAMIVRLISKRRRKLRPTVFVTSSVTRACARNVASLRASYVKQKGEDFATTLVIITSLNTMVCQALYLGEYAFTKLTVSMHIYMDTHWLSAVYTNSIISQWAAALTELICRSSAFLCYVALSQTFRNNVKRYLIVCIK